MSDPKALKLDPDSFEEAITAIPQEMGQIYEMSPTKMLKSEDSEKMTLGDGQDYQGLINTADAVRGTSLAGPLGKALSFVCFYSLDRKVG